MDSENSPTPPNSRGYEGFGGVVAERASHSTPWWPAEQRAPRHAPNVIVVLVDDLGFSDLSPFGAEIDTPYIQALADEGFRFTNYHSTPLCAPSRAALLTGVNPHRAGFALVPHVDPGYPGYQMELPDHTPTVAESFRAGGYATFMVGKWHLTRESLLHDGADKSSWPLQRGFDRYYGSMDGFTSLFHPHRLVRDNSPSSWREFGDDYYLTDDLTNEAISMIGSLRANDRDKPFFLYFAHQAVHGPVQAKESTIAKYRGHYDVGWDSVRTTRFERQRAAGLFAADTPMSASGPDNTQGVPPWHELSGDEQRLYARHMEVYAAAVDAVDESVGRLVEHLKEIGEYENTIIVVTSDNGATGEGGITGTRSYFSRFVQLAGLPPDWCPDVERELELIGGPRVHGHYPRGWAHASNTPFRYYKGHAYAGGIHVPFQLSWPARLPRRANDNGVRTQYAYVTDLAPTLLALAGIPRVTHRTGVPVTEHDGVSFGHLLYEPSEPTAHHSQYVECGGQRGYFAGGYKIVAPHQPGCPFTEDGWELYHIDSDPAETMNLAPDHPERVTRMAARWHEAAWLNTVFPLNDDGSIFTIRPGSELRLSEPVTLLPGMPVLERFRSSKLTVLRSFRIEAKLCPAPDDGGVIVAHGDQGGGYVLFVENGELCFSYNAYGVMNRTRAPLATSDAVIIGVDFTALPKMCWDITISVDGVPIREVAGVHQLLGMAPFTGISVGYDYGGPVDWELQRRHGCFVYRGTLYWVRYTPGEKASYNPETILEIEELSNAVLE